MINLMMFVVLFLPGWSADTNPDAKIVLKSQQVEQYSSMTECKENEKSFDDMGGIYKKVYPYKDNYSIAVQVKCYREKTKI